MPGVASLDTGSLKSLHTLFETNLNQIVWVENVQIFFDKNRVFLKAFLKKRWRHIARLSVAKTIV